MKKLYKATAVMGVATFVAMVMGVIKAKLLAVMLGPVGVGILSQAMTFVQSAETVCGLGIGLGVTKYVSEAWERQDMKALIGTISTALFLPAMGFLVFFAVVLAFPRNISQFVFSSPDYAGPVAMASVGVLFSILIISLESALLGMRKAEVFSTARIIYYVLGAALMVLLVSTMKLLGGFVFIVANTMMSLIVVSVFLFFSLKLKESINFAGGLRYLKKIDLIASSRRLLSYGTLTLVTAATSSLALLYVRSLIIRYEGASANGLYQVVFTIVTYYGTFFTNGVWGYLFPKLSATSQTSVFNLEVNKMLRFVILFLTPCVVLLFLFRKAVVVLVFSREFLGSVEIFPLYLLGSLFFLVSYMLGSTFLAKKQLKSYFFINMGQSILYVALFARLVPRFGLLAVAISYCATNFLACLVNAAYQTYRIGLVINVGNVRLFISSILFISVIFFVPGETFFHFSLSLVLVAMWVRFVIGKREKALLLSFVGYR